MKTLITIMTMVAFTIAIGAAYADEMPVFGLNKDTGTLFSENTAVRGSVLAESRPIISGAGSDELPVFGSSKDTGTIIYEHAFAAKDMVLDKEVRGSAAGGMAKDDENIRIWDTLLAPKRVTNIY